MKELVFYIMLTKHRRKTYVDGCIDFDIIGGLKL